MLLAEHSCGTRCKPARLRRTRPDSQAWRDRARAIAPQRSTSLHRCARRARLRRWPRPAPQAAAAIQRKIFAQARDRTGREQLAQLPCFMDERDCRGSAESLRDSALENAKGEKRMGFSPFVRSPACYFFGGAMTSLAALATRNFTTVLALILIAAPVCGLRPMRALRSAFTRRPMPGMMKTPFFLVSLRAVSASRSRKAALCLLVSSSFSASCRVRAVLVNPVAMCVFSFWASPLGCRCCLGFLRIARTAWGSATEATLARFPCIHAGPENPVVRYNATSGWVKSMEKPRFPQVFRDFDPISPIFA